MVAIGHERRAAGRPTERAAGSCSAFLDQPTASIRYDWNDGPPLAEPLNLLVEIKGFAREDASAENDTMTSLRLPGVDNHGRFGRWHFVAIRDIFGAAQQLDEAIAGLRQVRAA